jgi:8-oxo-dGTP pyrophosphatase MutT (NUDIX family)
MSQRGVTVLGLSSGRMPSLRVERRPAGAPATHAVIWTDAMAQAWGRMVDANPRLHDGPIWSVRSADASGLIVEADQYRRLTVQDDPTIGDLGVRVLGVKGMLVAHDETGAERLLLGRRGRETRVSGGLWEIAPAGGVSPRRALDERVLHETLAEEMHEELGMEIDDTAATPLCLVRDDLAWSVDVVMAVTWPVVVPSSGAGRVVCAADGCAWEYVDAAWLSRAEVAAFVDGSRRAVSPPTLAVLQWAGWCR